MKPSINKIVNLVEDWSHDDLYRLAFELNTIGQAKEDKILFPDE